MREMYWTMFAVILPFPMFAVWCLYLLPTGRRYPRITFLLIPILGALITFATVEAMCRVYDQEQQRGGDGTGRGGSTLGMSVAKSHPTARAHFEAVY